MFFKAEVIILNHRSKICMLKKVHFILAFSCIKLSYHANITGYLPTPLKLANTHYLNVSLMSKLNFLK